jgi:hypothetical protein
MTKTNPTIVDKGVTDFAKILKDPHEFSNGRKVPIYEITTYHSLIQYIGYAKFLNRSYGNVYLRGQENLYKTLVPSVFRGCSKNQAGFITRSKHINLIVKKCSEKISWFNDLYELSKEPLLQHYGFKTRWIDLVDNVWIALWFGLHNWNTRCFDREYKNIIPRESDSNHCMYLLLVCSDVV